jgi:cyclophilin family peptidyl-prolyl cis-trans isomerase
MITTLLSIVSLLAPPADLDIAWEASAHYVQGSAYEVQVTLTAPAEVIEVPTWLLSPVAFEVSGKPLGKRGKDTIELPAGATLQLRFDLSPHLPERGSFTLEFASKLTKGTPLAVTAYRAAPGDLDFWQAPVESLGQYKVQMVTNRGSMLFEVYPDSAPNHVRNFLDLNHRGFFEGLVFHRVSPSFMIQGGDPAQRVEDSTRWTGGPTSRRLDAEFNERKHVRGILSAARTADPNSATSQFFVMTAANSGLDNKYSVFGAMLSGEEALDLISNASGTIGRDGTCSPAKPQQILHTYVLLPD